MSLPLESVPAKGKHALTSVLAQIEALVPAVIEQQQLKPKSADVKQEPVKHELHN